jgi:hypothetical protein
MDCGARLTYALTEVVVGTLFQTANPGFDNVFVLGRFCVHVRVDVLLGEVKSSVLCIQCIVICV